MVCIYLYRDRYRQCVHIQCVYIYIYMLYIYCLLSKIHTFIYILEKEMQPTLVFLPGESSCTEERRVAKSRTGLK